MPTHTQSRAVVPDRMRKFLRRTADERTHQLWREFLSICGVIEDPNFELLAEDGAHFFSIFEFLRMQGVPFDLEFCARVDVLRTVAVCTLDDFFEDQYDAADFDRDSDPDEDGSDLGLV